MTDCFRFFFPVLLLGTINAQQPVYNYLVPAASNEMASRPRSILYFSQQNNGHHNPAAFLEGVRRSFGERGIQFTNSTQISSLTAANLSSFDGIFFFGNFYAFPEQTQTDIIDFTNNGGGITAMHVASYSFRNLPRLLLRPPAHMQAVVRDNRPEAPPTKANGATRRQVSPIT